MTVVPRSASPAARHRVLELTLHPNAPLTEHFIPAVVSSTGKPIPLTGAAARAAAAHYASLRSCARLTARPT